MNPWIIAAIALCVLALLIVVIVLLVRRRRRGPAPPKETPLSSLWAQFRRGLPASARGDPTILVLGERLSGKSRAIQASFERSGRPALASPNAPDDRRLALWAGRGALIQELSGELLEDARPEARRALRALWETHALETPLVVVVLDTSAPSWTPGGLRRLGALARDRIDLLTALRGSPPGVRVCLSHLDESAEGFVEAARMARDTDHSAALAPSGTSPAQLAATIAPLEAALAPSLSRLTAAEFSRLTRFLGSNGPRLLGALSPFLDALVGASTGAPPPVLEGIVLAALPEGGVEGMLGDPLLIAPGALARDARALDRRRTRWATVAGAVGAAILLGLYGWHYGAVERAKKAVETFRVAGESGQEPQQSWSSDGRARDAEARAAEALDAALDPLWPPLAAAFPTGKQNLADVFLQAIRELYLFPAARGPDRTRRIRALSLIYASRDNELGEHVAGAPEAWAADLEVPLRVVHDYLRWSESPWPGTVPPPPAGLDAVTYDQWQTFFEDLDAKLQRSKVSRAELTDLQKRSKVLSDSVQGALEVRGLERVVWLLEQARRPEMDAFLGNSGALQRAPRWVSEHWEAIESLLGRVQDASLDVPSAQGKTLEGAVEDLGTIARGQGEGAPDVVYELVVGNRRIAYHTAALTTLVRASRAASYAQAFTDDVRSAGRAPFFGPGIEYAAVGLSLPARGPRIALPGMYTARVVEAKVRPPLVALDAALDASGLPREDRDTFSRFVRDETARYGAGYRAALWSYVQSYQLDAGSVASLRTDLEDMLGPASWFSDFWTTAAENAAIDAAGNVYMAVLTDALRPLQAMVPLLPDAKGKSPILDKYYAMVAPLIPALDATAPPPPPAAAPLGDRLSPLGRFGLAVLDQDKPAPLPQVTSLLDGSRLVDRSLRQPFLAPVELAYELALRSVERAVSDTYRDQVRPLVAPLFSRFPLDPRADVDASPADLLAVVGPKGTFLAAVDALLAPVCQKAQDRACAPRAPAGYRAVQLPAEAIELSSWASSIASVLWDEGGKPRPIALQARAHALPEVKTRTDAAVTLSFLRSGTTTVYGFNQAPAWQPLPVAWSTPGAASIGLELSGGRGGDPASQTYQAEGDAWRFYRLLCRAPRISHGVLTWPFDPPVAFDLQPDPWALVVPPLNRARRCVIQVARN